MGLFINKNLKNKPIGNEMIQKSLFLFDQDQISFSFSAHEKVIKTLYYFEKAITEELFVTIFLNICKQALSEIFFTLLFMLQSMLKNGQQFKHSRKIVLILLKIAVLCAIKSSKNMFLGVSGNTYARFSYTNWPIVHFEKVELKIFFRK